MKTLATILVLSSVFAACETNREFLDLGEVAGQLSPTAATDKFEINNSVGAIYLVPSNSSDVRVRAKVRVAEGRLAAEKARGPLKFADHVVLEQEGATVRVANAHARAADDDDWQMQITIELPEGVALVASCAVGLISAKLNTVNAAKFDVGVGSVRADFDEVSMYLNGTVATGDLLVHVRSTPPLQGARLEVATGRLSLSLPETADGKFEMATAAGEVHAAARYGLTTDRTGGLVRVHGSVGEGRPNYELRSSVGTVELH